MITWAWLIIRPWRRLFPVRRVMAEPGPWASRLVTGTRRAHSGLEEALADLKGTEATVSFSSGYATSLGVITSIADREDTVLMGQAVPCQPD